jgi:NhaA family Na+:H+ antiporter
VRAGEEATCARLLQDIPATASTFPGSLDVRTVNPPRGDNRYRVILRFDQERNLRRWLESEERRAWYEHAGNLIEAGPRIEDLTGTAQERPLALALAPLEDFVRTSVSGIGFLLLGTVVALVLANSPLSEAYARFWETKLTVGTPDFAITTSLRHWVNDGLMALFFFIVGLEIKREFLVGELRVPRQAALPIAAALGGAIVPGLVYLAFNLNSEAARGWGIPIGTDTAFSLGVISLLGSRVERRLLVFLTAFAIVDDIVAVLVIAFFYTETISWTALAVVVALLVILIVANVGGVRYWPLYAFLGLGVWVAVYESGVHGTIAGVLLAMTVPARSWINPSEFLRRARNALQAFESACDTASSMLSNEEQQQAAQTLGRLSEEVETPMTHLEHRFNPWVAYGILPIFALANAGIPLLSGLGQALASPVAWGVLAGLVLGKPVGITLFTWLAVRLRIADKPATIAWQQIAGVALLGGIGFTMSLFITDLAFAEGPFANPARIGILFGSLIAGGGGYLVLRATLPADGDDSSDSGG